MHRVYISASTQKYNVGVGQYGTEQDRMVLLADRVKYWLSTQGGKFVVFRNPKDWTLRQTVSDCNQLACELFIDNHSNAGNKDSQGTEVFYYNQGGTTSNSYKLATACYNHIATVSPGKDRGVLPDNAYYNGMYVIQNTEPTAVLIEHMYHTNPVEVADMIANMDKYAKAEAEAICEYFGEKWIEPEVSISASHAIDVLDTWVTKVLGDGINEVYWKAQVANGFKDVEYIDELLIKIAKAIKKGGC